MKRRIAVMIGSSSDLNQCRLGLQYLQEMAEENETIECLGVYINSIHRNTLAVFENLVKLIDAGVDTIIIGAVWANHLTGMVDAYLRYTLRNTHVRVIGVAFKDIVQRHVDAAILAITEVPGHNIIFNNFVGSDGFYQACVAAATSDFVEIELPKPRFTQFMPLGVAVTMAEA